MPRERPKAGDAFVEIGADGQLDTGRSGYHGKGGASFVVGAGTGEKGKVRLLTSLKIGWGLAKLESISTRNA